MSGERWASVLFLLCCCNGPDETPIECVDTWDSWAEGHLRTWCTPCHSSYLPEGQRYGAPLGIDFDRYETTLGYAAAIAGVATGPTPTMPPEGGASAEERQRLADWVTCGAPGVGSTLPPHPCDDGTPVVVSGPVSIGTAADAAQLCTGPTQIDGDLDVVGSVDIDCLCGVTGSVTVSGGAEVALPGVSEIGGALTVEGVAGLVTVDVGRLSRVGGDIRFADLPLLTTVALPWLRQVDGDLIVRRLAVADLVDLTRLRTVGATLELSDIPAFHNLVGQAGALDAVGGDLILSDLDDWRWFYGFDWLTVVGGTVRIHDIDRASQIGGFNYLRQAGALEIVDNRALRTAAGFGSVEALSGGLVVRGNDALTRFDTLESLATIGGDLIIENNTELVGMAGLEQLSALVGDATFEGDSIIALPGFTELAAIGGTLTVHGTELSSLDGLTPLRTVGGLTLTGNHALVDVTDLHGLTEVSGDVRIEDNRALPGKAADALVEAIDVIVGSTTIRDNGS